jgi:hypothetical protein
MDQWLNWEFEAMATFQSQIPDIVFQHQDCCECEATRLLSSVTYANGEWTPRVWVTDGEASESIMIDSSHQYGEYLWEFACAHRIWDRDANGRDDVLVYCRAYGHDRDTEELKVTREDVRLYRVVGDRMQVQAVESPEGQ